MQNVCACLHDHAHLCLRVLWAPKRVNMCVCDHGSFIFEQGKLSTVRRSKFNNTRYKYNGKRVECDLSELSAISWPSDDKYVTQIVGNTVLCLRVHPIYVEKIVAALS